MKRIFFLLLFLSVSSFGSDSHPIGVYEFEPLVIIEDGKFSGFLIDIFDSIANNLNLEYHYKDVGNVHGLLKSVVDSTVDIGVAGVTIKGSREDIVDFSHPYLNSGLNILIKNEKTPNPLLIIKNYFQRSWGALWRFFLFLAFCSLMIYWLEKGKPSFDDNLLKGFCDGIYWTNTTMTTVGYGDKTPLTFGGKTFAILVMWIGIVVVFPYFVAQMNQVFTAESNSYSISCPEDLKGKRVATKRGIAAVETLEKLGAIPVERNTMDSCYVLLEDSDVDAVVYDMPPIRSFVKKRGNGKFVIVGDIFDKQDYGFVFQEDSEFYELVNTALLKFMDRDGYEIVKNRWLGAK